MQGRRATKQGPGTQPEPGGESSAYRQGGNVPNSLGGRGEFWGVVERKQLEGGAGFQQPL